MAYLAYFQQNAKNKLQRCSSWHQQITQNDVYSKIDDVTNLSVYLRFKQDYINFFTQAAARMLQKDCI